MITQLKEVSLEELLLAREQRAEKQRELIEIYGANLISFMVNIPGKLKNTPLSRKIFYEGLKGLNQKLKEKNVYILYEEICNKSTGMASFILIDINELLLKKLLVDIEDNHPIGRLFDFDVINKNYKVLTRSDIGQASRKCLICEENASICVRSQKHSYEELIKKIITMTNEYFGI